MIEYKGYLGKVEYDSTAKLLHGEVLGIRDVVTFQARSVDELDKAFCESVDDYLDFCRSRNEPPNKSYSGQFLTRIAPELHRRLVILAETEGKSLNSLAAELLARGADAVMPVPRSTSPKRKRKSA